MRLCVWVSVECTCLWFSCVFESLPRWENNRQRPFHVHFLGFQHRAASLRPRCSTGKNAKILIPVSAAGRLSRPGLCSALWVWDHFRLLDVLLCCCASESMWPCIFHTLFSYQRFNSFAQTPPEGIEDLISGIIVHVRRRIQTVLFGWFFLKMKWGFLFQITCFPSPSPSMII